MSVSFLNQSAIRNPQMKMNHMKNNIFPWMDEKHVLVRREAAHNSALGQDPCNRPIAELLDYSIVNIDKPSGPSSHQVSAYVKNILCIDKSGHSGTLDPKVTGALPVGLGRGTRIVQSLLTAGKEYICLMNVHDDKEPEKVKQAMMRFVGEIDQLPPVRSAVKRQLRKRTIYYIDIIEIKGRFVLFRVGCQAGTYIRKLCLHPATEIITKEGLTTASDFYSSPHNVFSYENKALVEKKPSALQKTRSPDKLVKITVASGISFTVTPDHELLKSNPNGPAMARAEALKQGDYLMKSLKYPVMTREYAIPDLLDDSFLVSQNEIKSACKKAFVKKYGSIRAMNRAIKLDRKAFLSKSGNAITLRHLKLAGVYEAVKHRIREFKTEKGGNITFKNLNKGAMYLLGLIASDGNNTKEKRTTRFTRLKFHNKNEALIHTFLKEYKKLFPSIPISKRRIKGGIFQLDTSNSFFATIAASLGIKSPHKNSDLTPLLYLEPKLIRAFLKGYFDGDGGCYFKKKIKTKGNYTSINFFTINPSAAKKIHQMLLKLGISSSIFDTGTPGYCYVSLDSLAAKEKFIQDIGSNHEDKKKILEKIALQKSDRSIIDRQYLGFEYKEAVRMNKKKLHFMGGNLSRILKGNMPVTRTFYQKCAAKINLPPIEYFVIEKIKKITQVQGDGYVYDMTIPQTHNFLIETGFVSSNCSDIGKELGSGAHMAELRRTMAASFDESTLCTLQDLTDAYYYYNEKQDEAPLRRLLQPIENGVRHLPKAWVLDSTVHTLCHGAFLNIPGIAKLHDRIEKGDRVAVMTLNDELVCVGIAQLSSDEVMKKDKGLFLKPEQVFMLPDLYPKNP